MAMTTRVTVTVTVTVTITMGRGRSRSRNLSGAGAGISKMGGSGNPAFISPFHFSSILFKKFFLCAIFLNRLKRGFSNNKSVLRSQNDLFSASAPPLSIISAKAPVVP